MKTTLLVAATIASAIAVPALAQPASDQPPPQRKACLQIGQIYNWDALNDKTLIVEDNWHRKFKLKLIGTCYNLKFHEALAFRSPGSLSISCLQPGDTVVQHDFGTGRSTCAITSIETYTHEMEAADKAAAAAKTEQGGQ